jgi:hypothetical protein
MDKFWTNHPHPPIKETKQFLGDTIWNNYFKFAFVRNPYEIAVSRLVNSMDTETNTFPKELLR